MKITKVGVIGCGNISGTYLNCIKRFNNIEVVALADLVKEKAEAKAKEHRIPKVLNVDEILTDPEIEIILNLTVPKAHAEVSLKVLESGKHVYNEKPLAVTVEDARQILDLASKNNLKVGCAPDTFLGAGIQTCRKIIDDGLIGEPVSATAFMMCHGHESWHPDPEFYYEVGGGPVLDMGPYYITALVNLMGPVESVTGSARVTFPERTITSEPKNGKKVKVETPTHIASVINFKSGAIASVIMSFDVWHHSLPCIEIYGTEGSLQVPDPNCFCGPVKIRKSTDNEWTEVPLTHNYDDENRGVGLSDMAEAIQTGRQHRANSDMAFHVLEIIESTIKTSEENSRIKIESTCDRPEPLLPKQ